jgi:hypothetical protein
MFLVPNCRTEFLAFLRFFPPFISRVFTASTHFFCARFFSCRQASVVTRWHQFLGGACDELGIGGDGEYCGDNDAHLGRTNVLYHGASSGKYVVGTVLFDLEPGVIDALRAPPLGELFSPFNLIFQSASAGNWTMAHYTRAGHELC